MTTATIEDATCPFCGLTCDDLAYETDGRQLRLRTACPRAQDAVARANAAGAATPRVGGRAASPAQATAAAAEILAAARQPVIGGFATDLSGARAVLALADACGAVVDHLNSEAKLRNLLTVQDGGWVTTTLAEVKNRADLIVVVGTDVVSRFPRFFERVVWNEETLFGLQPGQRDIVYIGAGLDTAPGRAPDGREAALIPAERTRLGEAFACMAALQAGETLRCDEAAGVPVETWRGLVERIAAASYCVVVWAAADLDVPHGALHVQALAELIRRFNRSTRVCGLPLGGTDGEFTANGVHMWQTGFPYRTSFAADTLHYDPHLNGCARMLAAGEADALLWISSFDGRRAPPAWDGPTVVLGTPDMACPREPEVFVPVGTPGVDHAGQLFRTDKVVALPLRPLRDIGLPSVARVVADIQAALPK